MRRVAILDTSWLLELYQVPGDSEKSRTRGVKEETARIVNAGGNLFVTVPVLFEVANHITRVADGGRRRDLPQKLLGDVKGSFERESPWTIVAVGKDVLLRSEDVIRLANRFRQESGPNYSFASISIIDLSNELQGKKRTVEILTFHDQLKSYSG